MESLIRADRKHVWWNKSLCQHVPFISVTLMYSLTLATKWTSHCNSWPCSSFSSSYKIFKSANVTHWDNKLFLITLMPSYPSSYLSDFQQSKCPGCHSSRKQEQIVTLHTHTVILSSLSSWRWLDANVSLTDTGYVKYSLLKYSADLESTSAYF